ncbi:GerMN domain-containing protein [Streptomyces sp. NBC_01198]|uniref:GerMN domain-containing protein n=1 Tax=Streptomyces sp. NBC_01198 TaxID=2903769 RepID=UPI002E1348DB|nr:GerMN domain-containing protein [Streptomyces sp. NBC_01198]
MRARVALLTAAGLLLAGCGIPTTGVVEAGEPGVGVHQDVTLYFVRAADGSLVTVPRRAQGTVDAATVVTMLANGVGATEQKAMGLTSALPPPVPAPSVRTQDGTVTVDLRAPAEELSGTAVDQVVCTLLANRVSIAPRSPTLTVTVTAEGTAVPQTSADPCAGVREFWRPGPTKPPPGDPKSSPATTFQKPPPVS